jgi:hypothetical protein
MSSAIPAAPAGCTWSRRPRGCGCGNHLGKPNIIGTLLVAQSLAFLHRGFTAHLDYAIHQIELGDLILAIGNLLKQPRQHHLAIQGIQV